MTKVLDKLASALGERDETPNLELAKKIDTIILVAEFSKRHAKHIAVTRLVQRRVKATNIFILHVYKNEHQCQ